MKNWWYTKTNLSYLRRPALDSRVSCAGTGPRVSWKSPGFLSRMRYERRERNGPNKCARWCESFNWNVKYKSQSKHTPTESFNWNVWFVINYTMFYLLTRKKHTIVPDFFTLSTGLENDATSCYWYHLMVFQCCSSWERQPKSIQILRGTHRHRACCF